MIFRAAHSRLTSRIKAAKQIKTLEWPERNTLLKIVFWQDFIPYFKRLREKLGKYSETLQNKFCYLLAGKMPLKTINSFIT
ncbi:hypothetical protein HCUR_00294 [Holospora curviuscula]|uniref:Uncharacterized protein n=1 Tax=Holospora curviuscula TaxID=1082868 RepID=A0A2S5RDE2_9PROT|nr:hypothetical protein HCUR_00294 [Holospora curviuscula]